MELERKTTILFSPALHDHLKRVARKRKVSLGLLVREACEKEYGAPGAEDERLAAVKEIAALSLPVGTPQEMKSESVPTIDELEPRR